MASRINKRFLLLVITVAGGLAIAVGAIALVAYRNDPTRNLRRAEAAAARGDLEMALKEYGRAASKRPSDLEILKLYEDTLLQLKPESQERAEELYADWLTVLRLRAQILSGDPAVQLPFLNELYRNARLTGQEQWYREVSEMADEAMERSSSLAEGYLELAFLRLAAESSHIDMEGADEVGRIDRELAQFLTDHPDHTRAAAAYALFLLRQGHAQLLDRNTAGAQAQFAKAQKIIDDARANAPDDPELALAHARLLGARMYRGESAAQSEIDGVIAEVVRTIGPKDDEVLLHEAAAILPMLHRMSGVAASIELLRSYLDRHPGAVLERYNLARLLFEDGQHEAALPEIDALLESEALAVSFFATYRYQLQLLVAQILFYVEHGRCAELAGAEYDAQLERARQARDRLANMAPGGDENLLVMECDAWLALSELRYDIAASKFHDVVSRSATPDARRLWGYARALELTGATGRALEALQAAPQEVQLHPQFQFETARLEAQLGRYSNAVTHLEQSLAVRPDFAPALELLNQIRGAMDPGQAEGSLGIVKSAEDLLNAGDLTGARALLLEALAAQPDDATLAVALIQVENRGDWKEEALARVEELIARRPDDANLKALRESVRGGDAIAVLKAAIDARYADPVDRTAWTYVALRRMVEEQRARAAALEADGRTAEAAAAEDLVSRANAEADAQLQKAIALGASQPDFIDRRFADALARGDKEEAQRLADLAREDNADQARGLTYEARVALVNRDFEKAVATLVEASRVKPYDAWIWRTLAITYLELGNLVDARAAFDSALRQNPNDTLTIRMFANLLAEGGDYQGALSALRDAADRRLNDPALVELWLNLEARHGSVGRAIAERQRRRASDPGDRTNTLALAMLLGSQLPERSSILDDQFEPRYSERQWTAMGAAACAQAVEAEKQRWIADADVLFDELVEGSPDNLMLASQRALHYRNTGRAAEGRAYLESVVKAQLAREPDAAPYVSMAQYLFVIAALADAEQWLRDGLAHQDPAEREIDRALANFYMAAGDPARAAQHVQEALKGKDDRLLRRMLAELHIILGRLDDADRELTSLDKNAGTDEFEIMLLKARSAEARGNGLAQEGRTREADDAFRSAQESLDRAIELRNLDPRPLVMLASNRLGEYRRTRGSDATLLDDANSLLGRALQLAAGFAPAIQLRAEILLARTPPDVAGAVRELTTLLEANRWDEMSRRRIIELHLLAGQLDSAMAVTAEGAELEPHRPQWHTLLGQIHERRGDIVSATAAYKEALLREQNPRALHLWASTAIRTGQQALLSEVLSTLASNPAALEEFPTLRARYALALALSGRMDEARSQLVAARSSFKRLQDSETDPGALAEWMIYAAEVFRGRATVEDLEAFALEAAGGSLTRGEQYWLAREFVTTGEGGQRHSLELLRAALASAESAQDVEDQVEILHQIALGEHVLGELESAATHYEKVLTLSPDHLITLNNLAYIYADALGAPERGVPLAERAAALAPMNANVLDTYGVALLKAGRAAEAMEVLKRSVDLSGNAENHVHLAEALVELDRFAEATARLDQAAQLNPSPELLAEITELRQRLGE
jgi:tetratricopeptide (TPR) repeat protein